MPNEIRTKPITRATFTITLASLANSTTAGRQSTMVTNSSNYPGAIVFLRLRTGSSAPTANTVIEVFLLRGDGTNRTDNAGASDAALTVENAPLLGTVAVLTATTGKDLFAEFDTSSLGPLGTEWGIAVRNQSGTTLDTTGGNFVAAYTYYVPEVK